MTRFFLLTILVVFFFLNFGVTTAQAASPLWEFQAIDTMKYSRDPSGEYLENLEDLQEIADQQIKLIAETGATHVAIGTPYDNDFLPVLKVWVATARKYNLNVWFRGNFSGWEGWFGYSGISRAEHLGLLKTFLHNNPDLFKNGDVFSACPECENGGEGDPRLTGDVKGYRQFLIDEYQVTSNRFRELGLNVRSNFHSMNGDMAELIMDPATTQALGGLVVVDHYVDSPEELNRDITKYSEMSGGAKVILGEFGAPIPDIHGRMSPQEQADWVDESLALLAQNPNLVGLNYWTNMGGSTQLWNEDGSERPVVSVLKKYFTPPVATGKVRNTLGKRIAGATIKSPTRQTEADNSGNFTIAVMPTETDLTFAAPGYREQVLSVAQVQAQKGIELSPLAPSWLYRFRIWLQNLL